MIRLTNSKAGNNSSKQHHSDYGIYNYFELKGITDAKIQSNIMDKFLELKGFKSDLKKGKLKQAKVNFIQNRFNEFGKFVKACAELF